MYMLNVEVTCTLHSFRYWLSKVNRQQTAAVTKYRTINCIIVRYTYQYGVPINELLLCNVLEFFAETPKSAKNKQINYSWYIEKVGTCIKHIKHEECRRIE